MSIFSGELKYIFDILLKNGDEVRVVGGCVRDFLLDRKINDFDLATKYRPDEVIKVLEDNNIKYLTNGIRFGVITIVLGKNKFEIATLRRDIKNRDRFSSVEFIDNYGEDAKRRDFTFNALYMDYDEKIYDYFGGIKDLKNGIIKFIGEPRKRIFEDSLRILRFFRFFSDCARFMSYDGFCACIRYKDRLNGLSKRRINEEMEKILKSNRADEVVKIMKSYDITSTI
jgi:poly(A) polymerase